MPSRDVPYGVPTPYLLFTCVSYLSAVTEKITGRAEDTCPDSTGNAKNDLGNSRMDIFRSEIACEEAEGSR